VPLKAGLLYQQGLLNMTAKQVPQSAIFLEANPAAAVARIPKPKEQTVCVRTVGPSVLRILAIASAMICKCLELLCPLLLLLES